MLVVFSQIQLRRAFRGREKGDSYLRQYSST